MARINKSKALSSRCTVLWFVCQKCGISFNVKTHNPLLFAICSSCGHINRVCKNDAEKGKGGAKQMRISHSEEK